MTTNIQHAKANFGTAPVFLTAIATILGAIMFLRFGYSVGNIGLLGTLAVVLVGHLVTIPTALAIAEIATNQKVEGGGEYFIISRSFGLNIGGSVGIALFLSQAISVAFYIVAFAQAFDPVISHAATSWGIDISDKRIFSIPTLILLAVLMLTKGADIGVKALYVVVATLAVSLFMFFLGSGSYDAPTGVDILTNRVEQPDPFFLVFAICFPAFTGMTAGVGLSGDLKDPKKSIPLGTLLATVIGMVTYVAIAYKLAISASPADLDADQLVMSKIAVWGPIIPIGLAAATISSALGSIMVAPRTLQALASDNLFPAKPINGWLARGKGALAEPVNASIVVVLIAFCFLLIGDVDFVAQIISMFFMVTYGSICLISFLQHWAADPSYRPTFKSRWYISLLGFLMCVWLMFSMSPGYAVASVAVMIILYMSITAYTKEKRGMAIIFQGAIFQLSRKLQVFLQKTEKEERTAWRPSIVCFGHESFRRLGVFELLRWLSARYGFGTYIHFIKGYLSKDSHHSAREALDRLIKMAHLSESNFYIDTLVSPSTTSAIAQIIQLPGISGKENNMILFEYDRDRAENLADIIDNYQLVRSADFDVCILGSSDRGFGYRNEIHVWLTSRDFDNANLMILLAFIVLGHEDWKRGLIKLYAVFPESELEDQYESLLELVQAGRLPITRNNIVVLPQPEGKEVKQIIQENSSDADLTIIGFRGESLKARGSSVFEGYDKVGNILFVNSTHEKEIS